MPKLKLLSLQCHQTEDNLGPDEPYLVVNQNVVWGPTSMGSGQSTTLQVVDPIEFAGNVGVQLFDQDTGFLDPDDLLGGISISGQQAGQGTRQGSFTGDGAIYTLNYEVLADPPPPPPPGGETPDGKKPVFPIVEEKSGARGLARVTIGGDGIVELYMKVDAPAGGSTTRYIATVLITGFKNNSLNNVLTDQIETHTLTVAGTLISGADKERSWFLPPVKPEDVNNIRHVRVQLERDKSVADGLTQFIELCRDLGEAWDAADTLYKKVKNSELGTAIALAVA